MSKSSPKPYHHGDIESEAVRVGLAMLDETPHEKISIRAVAEAVGVTHRAILRHFSSRDGFLTALAVQGFRHFESMLRGADKTPLAFVDQYVSFAITHPELYRVMMQVKKHERTKQVEAAQWAVIKRMRQVFASDREAKRAWMLVHGGISLHSAGTLSARSTDELKHYLYDLL